MGETLDETTAGALLTAIVNARLKPLVETLAGYELAIIAIVRKLDERGALPLSEAKAAIAGALAGVPKAEQAGPAATVLRGLQGRLSPSTIERTRH